MDDNPHSFGFNNQYPVIQLITVLIIIILPGTLLFYIFVFAGTLIFKTDITGMLSVPSLTAGIQEGSILKYVQVSQQVSLFIMPSIVFALLVRRGNGSFLKTDRLPGSTAVLIVMLLALLIIPVTSYTGLLNSKMGFPEWLSGVEEWMRAKENFASDLTVLLIRTSGPWELIINVFVIAVIPSIAEEMIFRGVFQQIFCRIFRSDHAGILITAIIFSAIHLQFYGFLPRLILGLCFGYLFFWSKNLWLPVIAHFINNCIPVVMSYYFGWEELSRKTSGLSEKQILVPMFSSLLIVMILYYFRSEHRKNLPGKI